MPLTGAGVVDLIVTDLAVFDVARPGLTLVDLAPDVSLADVRAQTGPHSTCIRTSPDADFRGPRLGRRGLRPRASASIERPLEAGLVRALGKTGAVAQLGERLNGIQEVRGSIPLGSTIAPR